MLLKDYKMAKDILKGYRGNSTGDPPWWLKKLFSKKSGGEVNPSKRKTDIPLNKPEDQQVVSTEEEYGITTTESITPDIATEEIKKKEENQ